ncbi:hypothetical protein PGTUg99_033488 [Puccinia graminis f. sp. tritici]|uniref:Uncharacterized protein n=1 Tax=Puccinia graminis f. sp. tritici TaxID=56615 RepID=A0A5B0RWT0_PUCGR|nr:hypothetical protein PGTUg99_033488 [Puccinia graminis f. sp. tritici]
MGLSLSVCEVPIPIIATSGMTTRDSSKSKAGLDGFLVGGFGALRTRFTKN